jgi:hypothetical protein
MHLNMFRVFWVSVNRTGGCLRSSVVDFSGVGRGYRAQDACYWPFHTILVGCSMQRRHVCGVRPRGKGFRTVRAFSGSRAMVGRVVRANGRVGWGA